MAYEITITVSPVLYVFDEIKLKTTNLLELFDLRKIGPKLPKLSLEVARFVLKI